MATSTNYLWTEPNDSDLVKNGASAIRTLGNAIDASVWSLGFGQAGKNKIINGDFGIWQRGTSFSNPASATYCADRWKYSFNGTGATRTISQQAFTAGTAPVSGYEGQFFLRLDNSVVGSGNTLSILSQNIEDVRTFAGQTITLSFWMKTGTARACEVDYQQVFGSGGSTTVDGTNMNFTTTTSWARYTFTMAIPSITGKTVGTGSSLNIRVFLAANVVDTFDIWGVQVEAGSTATPFQTASGGSLQGELAACQRYYFRQSANASNAYAIFGLGTAISTTSVDFPMKLPVTMRTTPATTLEVGGTIGVTADNATIINTSALALVANENQPDTVLVRGTVVGATQYRPYILISNNVTTSYIGMSAEL